MQQLHFLYPFKKKSRFNFNRHNWLEMREERKYMVEDLMQQEYLINMTKNEVIDFLGCEFNDFFVDVWTYYLGTIYFFPYKKVKNLKIYFNNEGMVYKTMCN